MAEAGAMAAMSAGIRMTGSAGPGGVGKALIRRAAGGESFFMGKFQAEIENAWVALAPRYPGDIAVEDIPAGTGLLVQQGSLLGVGEGLHVDVKWAGMRSVIMKEGITLLHIDGEGTLLMSSYGGIQRFQLGPGEKLMVDTGHLVAFSDNMNEKVGMAGGAVSSATTGEGLVATLEGPGLVFIQTRAEQSLMDWLFPTRNQRDGRR